jgi:hypothetical protein
MTRKRVADNADAGHRNERDNEGVLAGPAYPLN